MEKMEWLLNITEEIAHESSDRRCKELFDIQDTNIADERIDQRLANDLQCDVIMVPLFCGSEFHTF